MLLKDNLRAGTAVAASFLGIGMGTRAQASPANPRARAEPSLKKNAEGDGTSEDDDDALDDDDDGKDAPDENDDEETSKAKRARRKARKAAREKAAKEAEDDDGDADMRGNSVAAQARLRERARCAAIFGCEAAKDNIEMAAHLAFNTRLTRAEAISTLERAPQATPGAHGATGLDRAMDAYAQRRPGQDAAPAANAQQAVAAGWDKALKRR